MYTEIDNYYYRIQDLREQVINIITGLSAEALNWRPMDNEGNSHSFNSIAVLAAHIAGAEEFWISEVIGRNPHTRNRDEEFATNVKDSSILIKTLRETGKITNKILYSISDEDLKDVRIVENKEVPVRWGILHIIDHTSLHLGHIQITYQLFFAGKSKESPFWYERLN